MDVAQWTLEVAKVVGPTGAVFAIWLLLRKQPVQAAVTLSKEPPPGVDRMIELLQEIRDSVRDAGHERKVMTGSLKRIERRQSTQERLKNMPGRMPPMTDEELGL